MSKNGIKRGAVGKEDMLSCCSCLFEYTEANLALIPPENLQYPKHVMGKMLRELVG